MHEIAHNFGALHDCIQGCSLGRNFPSCCPLSTNTCDSQFNFISMSFISPSNQSLLIFALFFRFFSVAILKRPCKFILELFHRKRMYCSSRNSRLELSGRSGRDAKPSPNFVSILFLFPSSPCTSPLHRARHQVTHHLFYAREQNCGNGIVEEGEDCDPGNLSDPCCNASTCSFVPSATCSPLNSNCCTSQCQLASSGTICRESLDPMCDIAQRCDGESLICPERCYVVDSNPCGDDNLACASGRCTNLDQQCAAVGSAFGITDGCPVTPPPQLLCNIVCAAGNNRCTVFDQIVRDGTPCGGKCSLFFFSWR